MPRTVHIIGNGDSSVLYHEEKRKGLKLTCNLAPFEIPDSYAACMRGVVLPLTSVLIIDGLYSYNKFSISNVNVLELGVPLPL